MQEVRNGAKLELGDASVLIAWWSCAFQLIAWVCGHNAGGLEPCKVRFRIICSVLIQPGGHVHSSKLLGCVVTMQEVRICAKFALGDSSVLI